MINRSSFGILPTPRPSSYVGSLSTCTYIFIQLSADLGDDRDIDSGVTIVETDRNDVSRHRRGYVLESGYVSARVSPSSSRYRASMDTEFSSLWRFNPGLI